MDSYTYHFAKSIHIRSFSGLYFPVFGPNTEKSISPYLVLMRENTDQKNYEYFSLSDIYRESIDMK